MKITLVGWLAILCGTASLRAESPVPREPAKHVVLIVWDGMRPDFVTETNAPTLWKLAQEGVTFRDHHSIYPTLTSVNAAVLATGVFPNRSGRIGNYEYRPDLDPIKTMRMDAADTIRAADKASGGKYLAVPTIPELLQTRGERTAIAGTKSAPLLFDRNPRGKSVTIAEGGTLPPSARESVSRQIGGFPANDTLPSVTEDNWTARALTESLWQDGVPEFSVLWMADPDRSQHANSPGDEIALAGIKSVDADLAIVLDALEKKGARTTTDILITSDHGFSTIENSVNLPELLTTAGFKVIGSRASEKTDGDVRIVGNGGSVFLYVDGHATETVARLVRWLQESNLAGVIFSRAGLTGTFPLSRVHVDTKEGPDVILAFRWNDRRNEHDVPGMISANGSGDAKGTHGTLSKFDVHNILFAVGPHFRRGFQSDLPSSNLDVAASIMYLLALRPAQPIDGRILIEALRDGTAPAPPKTRTEEVTSGNWRQYLRLSQVGDTIYCDEGNGGQVRD